ncbi:MAG TPA: esterase-like activity of phytase family protein [Beijerinckiaceae bacterium]|nr:esterase-like activity of phytase family protein [Beijerinckiaceae bacterium]
MRLVILVLSIGIGTSAVPAEESGLVTPIQVPHLPLGLVTLQKTRAINLAVSPGAGAFRLASDPPGRIWTVTDRGPVVDCSEERETIGPDDKAICAPDRRGKIYLLPGYVPSIYALDVNGDGTARFAEMIPLRGKSGKLLSGLTNPLGPQRTETGYTTEGRVLDTDPSGIEPGGLVRLADGTFWIAEKFGPSLLEVARDGQVLRRLVPANLEPELKGADYAVEPAFPSILSLRAVARGFDAIAISPDERFLYVAMQNALANPALEAYRHSPATRIWKIERTSGRIVAEYVYRLDPPGNFPADTSVAGRPLRQSDVRIAEIVAMGENRLLVLERVRHGSRIFVATLSPGQELPPPYDDEKTRPSLEELFPDVWEIAGIAPVKKMLLVDSERIKGIGGRLTAMAVLSPRELVLMSNNVYGVEGGRSQTFRLTFSAPVFQ